MQHLQKTQGEGGSAVKYPSARPSFRFGSNMLQHSKMNPMNDVIRPQMLTFVAALDPPYWLPSLSSRRISIINSSRDIPSSAPTRGSCSGASAIPRRSKYGASHRANRVQNRHSASQNNPPRACRPFPSVYSLTSEIIAASASLLCVLCELCVLCVKSFSSNLPLPTFNQ